MTKPLSSAKIAVYYDWLYTWGGAEKVLLNILSIFPNAEVFTLFSDHKKISWFPQNQKIHSSFLQNFPKTLFLSPIYDIAAESFDLSNYDIVISTTSNVGHCLLTQPNTLFICYYHNLNRHLYLNPPRILKPIINLYQKIDRIYSKRPDYAICNSITTQNRLQTIFDRKSLIINPGIDTNYFVPISKPANNFFLVVSRLVPHKNIDYLIKTFKANKKSLIIVGSGRDEKRLKNISHNSTNIKFTGQIDNQSLLQLYQNCCALICPQIEDFGLVSLEAQSCGRPVIALNRGGITETVINHQTGVFYNEQNQQSLNNAIYQFEQMQFNSTVIRKHILIYDEQNFMLNFKKEVKKLWQKHQLQTTFL